MAAWQPCSACAQDDRPETETDTQFWFYTIVSGEVAPNTSLTVDGSARWREDARGDEQATLRATVLFDVADQLALGGGAGVFEAAGGASEIRLHQQANAELGRMSSRTRLEQRFFDRADRMELRLRQRLRYSQPVARRFSAHIEAEWLHLIQTRDSTQRPMRDQWRGRVLARYDLRRDLSLTAAYLAIYDPAEVGPDRLAHIPQLILDYRF